MKTNTKNLISTQPYLTQAFLHSIFFCFKLFCWWVLCFSCFLFVVLWFFFLSISSNIPNQLSRSDVKIKKMTHNTTADTKFTVCCFSFHSFIYFFYFFFLTISSKISYQLSACDVNLEWDHYTHNPTTETKFAICC